MNPQEKHKILIVDDHEMFLDGLKSLLESRPEYEVVFTTSSGYEVLDYLENQTVDLVVSDLSMPIMDGVDLVKQLKAAHPDVKILVLSMHNNRDSVREVLMAEAEGYILKDAGKEELFNAINKILDNGTYYSQLVTSIFLETMKQEVKAKEKINPLTERELKVLQHIIMENSSDQIAENLFISRRTVDTHRINLLRKTKSATVVGLVKFAFENGLYAGQVG
ncbi:MAG: response regulator transcription factor [Bacteroidota bacterium]